MKGPVGEVMEAPTVREGTAGGTKFMYTLG